jgi:uncharacterized protein (TIGR03435 family)
MKRMFAGASLFALSSLAAFSQTAPAFEVATVKPAAPQEMGRVMVRMGNDPGRINYVNVSLRDVLARAYSVKQFQIAGPAWLDTERYDINAKIPEGVAQDQVPAMLQTLLTERFKMTVHKENKEAPIYALIVAKGGPKLKKAEETDDPKGPVMKTPDGAAVNVPRGGMAIMNNGRNAEIRAMGTTLARFADMLSRFCDRPVFDETKIEGNYDFVISVAAEELARAKGGLMRMGPPPGGGDGGGHTDEASSGDTIFTAVQNFGLKLEPKKAPLDRIVIESADKVPTEN